LCKFNYLKNTSKNKNIDSKITSFSSSELAVNNANYICIVQIKCEKFYCLSFFTLTYICIGNM
jgi:hypothetical protein